MHLNQNWKCIPFEAVIDAVDHYRYNHFIEKTYIVVQNNQCEVYF